MKRKILAGMLLMDHGAGNGGLRGEMIPQAADSPRGTEESTDTEASGQEEASSGTEETDGEASQGRGGRRGWFRGIGGSGSQ